MANLLFASRESDSLWSENPGMSQPSRGLVLALAALDPPANRFAAQVLVEDHYVAVMRRGHPITPTKLDLTAFATLLHLVISASGEDLGFVDAALAAQGLARSIALEAPYLSAGAVLT